MKATLYDQQGNKKSQIELPKVFESKIREDIVAKYFESDKFIQPYSSKLRAGLHQSASGTISHKRHDWKGHYGRGISRIPRKTMWRRGTQFFWVGATAPGTRGGRKAHPPKGIGKEKKINKKEAKLAFNSGFAATANPKYIKERYSTIEKVPEIPAIIEALPKKTKELMTIIKNIFKEHQSLVLKNKTIRPGKGRLRGRKYKSNAGVLIVTSPKETAKFKGVDIKTTDEVSISDFYPLGRLAIYTQGAIDALQGDTKK